MHQEQRSETSLPETQFYSRTSNTPITKLYDPIYRKFNENCSSLITEETFHDAIENLSIKTNPMIDIERKKVYVTFVCVRFVIYEKTVNVKYAIVDRSHMNSSCKSIN